MTSERDFWSRRRAAVQAEEAAEQVRTVESDAQRVQARFEDRPEDEVLAELDLPVPESVCSGEDVQKFMARAVPEYLRRRALRTLWRSNPVLACLDGLNDYDGDFTNAATDAPGVKTAYQVGKGLKAHVDYLAAQKEAREAAAAQALTEEDSSEEDAGIADSAPTEAQIDTAQVEDAAAPEDDTDIEDQPRPRRMAFRFDGDAA